MTADEVVEKTAQAWVDKHYKNVSANEADKSMVEWFARAFVEELGVTAEMVEAVTAQGFHSERRAAADALALLLEIAGGERP